MITKEFRTIQKAIKAKLRVEYLPLKIYNSLRDKAYSMDSANVFSILQPGVHKRKEDHRQMLQLHENHSVSPLTSAHKHTHAHTPPDADARTPSHIHACQHTLAVTDGQR